jgi:ribulose-5-phosphate 4-epimerase/fuculose-1-phosphate aldolase
MRQTEVRFGQRYPDCVGEEEWAARVDLAACYRLVALYGMTDLIYNHISAQVPGHDDQYLINPYGMLYEEITASSLVKIDIEGGPCCSPITATTSTWPASICMPRSTGRGLT